MGWGLEAEAGVKLAGLCVDRDVLLIRTGDLTMPRSSQTSDTFTQEAGPASQSAHLLRGRPQVERLPKRRGFSPLAHFLM